MNSECVLESRDTPTAGNNLIPISVLIYSPSPQASESSPEEGHSSPKVLGKYWFFFKQLTGELFYCAWLPLHPSLKEGPHADPGDCEVRNPCRRSPTQQKWSGALPHPPPGGCPFQRPRPLRGLYPLHMNNRKGRT